METDSDIPPEFETLMQKVFENIPDEETHNEINQTLSDSDSVYRVCEICYTN